MEIQKTETSENSTLLPVTSTEATKTLDKSTLPLVADPQTTETSEQSTPPPVTSMQTAITSEQSTLPQVTNTQTTETLNQSALPQVTNEQTTENAEPLPEVTNTQPTLPPVTNTQKTEIVEQSNLPPLTNTQKSQTLEHSLLPSEINDNSHDNLVSSPENHEGMEMRQETAEEEVRSILKAMAATGKLWHDWDKLRSMLSIHLKQVLSEYPQAKMTAEEQKISLGETHAELVKRLDDALDSFVDGPPFTLQRLSEIMLDAQSLYPNLSKLAFALEKNLSVTSTLAISTDPYPPAMTTPNGVSTANSNLQLQSQSDTVVENGGQPQAADRDEIMTEVEADGGDVMTMDMETYEKPSESSPMATGNS